MFDGGTTTTMDAADEACREQDWVRLHGEIRSVFTQRTALKARQLALLLEADETRLYKRYGYTSITAYVVGELGYTHHSANEQMRVIQNELEDRLSEALLQERFGLGDTVTIDVQGDDVIMEKKEPAPTEEPALT